MTSLAIAPDSLDALKLRKDEVTRSRIHGSPESERRHALEREASAVRSFVAWFRRQHSEGGLALPAEHVLNVMPGLSRKFCVGMYDLRYFVGIPDELMTWFQDLPWSHIEVAPGVSRVSMRCKSSKAQGLSMPAFALNFDVHPVGYTQSLLNYHFLDFRAIEPMPAQGGAFRISREVYQTVPIRIGTPPRVGLSAA